MPIISGHAGNLQSIFYWVQDMQVAAIHLSGAGGAFAGSFLQGLHCCHSDSVMCAQVLGMHLGQDTLNQGIHINVFPALK